MAVTRRKIVVLFHKNDRHRDLSCYSVYHMTRVWRNAGHEVTFLFGTRRFVPADLALVHVNLSVVPEEYIRFAKRYPVALNGEVRDIRKRSFSDNILGYDSTWAGPVIVKSNLNYAGYPEQSLGRSWLTRRFPLARRVRRLMDRATGRAPRFVESTDYELYDSLGKVPPLCFGDPDIVVEKFLPEIRNGLYHTRVYKFLDGRGQCVRLSGHQPVVKVSTSLQAEEIEPHDEILDIKRRLRLDFGKLDYVINDGRVVLLDVNKTMGAGTGDEDDIGGHLSFRAEGLYTYFLSPQRERDEPCSRLT